MVTTTGHPDSRYSKYKHIPAEKLASPLTEKGRHQRLMRDAYIAQLKYENGEITREQRDELIEEAEDLYDIRGD